ncbi:hypothetical protein F5Y05DRAFT_222894 [Hypoxylon sp. FL0543]|nr:hypothetical protein F5Y05DRAFT_222894 [Hypoxylon sp. FL0543]
MSLHRWSLPSRAFNREKSKDGDSDQRGRFSTIHIGNPGARRRANLSSVFASLFEKDENRLQVRIPDDSQFSTTEIKPLSPRTTNIQSPPKPKDVKYDAVVHPSSTPIHCTLKRNVVDQLCPKEDEASKEHSLPTLPGEYDLGVKLSAANLPAILKSPTSVTRVRSTSSSYPSEGIRSPPEHCVSPPLDTWSESFMSELSLYGPYTPKQTSNESTVSTYDTSNLSGRAGHCLAEELAVAGGFSDTDTRTTSRDYTSKSPLSDIPTLSSQEQHYELFRIDHGGGLVVESTQKASDSRSCREAMQAYCCQSSSRSAVRGSYPDLQLSTRMSSSDDDTPFRPSKTDSMDRLHPSTETGRTHSTNIEEKSEDSTVPTSVSQTHPDRGIVTIPLSQSDYQPLAGLRFRNSNGSATTLVQRIQKFKLRRWFKKVCLRTKVRFDSAINQEVSSPKALGRKKQKSQKSRRPKKLGRAPRAKVKPGRSFVKPPKATKKTRMNLKEQGGKAYRFIRSLKKKNSIQFPLQNKSDASHRRVQSCPA